MGRKVVRWVCASVAVLLALVIAGLIWLSISKRNSQQLPEQPPVTQTDSDTQLPENPGEPTPEQSEELPEQGEELPEQNGADTPEQPDTDTNEEPSSQPESTEVSTTEPEGPPNGENDLGWG